MRILRLHHDWNKTKERKATNGYGGCGYYRIVKPSEQMVGEHEVDVWGKEFDDRHKELGKNTEMFYNSIFSEYDVVWTHYINNPVMFAWMYAAKEKWGTKLVIDIDDNFLDLDEGNPANEQMGRGKKDRSILATILSFADAITVSTFPLKKRLQEHIKEVHGIDSKIFVLPNYNDINDWNHDKVENKDGVVIGYMGSVSHADDLNMVLPSIKKVMEKYPNVGFQLMGQLTVKDAKRVFKDWPQSIRKRMFMIQPTGNQTDFPLHLANQPWDIGIAPLVDTPFNRSKSHIKWMEYSMYKIPTVASRVYPYYKDVLGKETIKDGETGLLVYDHEWVDKLSLLIENKELREKIGKNAYEFVKKEWQYKDNKEYILSVVKKIGML